MAFPFSYLISLSSTSTMLISHETTYFMGIKDDLFLPYESEIFELIRTLWGQDEVREVITISLDSFHFWTFDKFLPTIWFGMKKFCISYPHIIVGCLLYHWFCRNFLFCTTWVAFPLFLICFFGGFLMICGSYK